MENTELKIWILGGLLTLLLPLVVTAFWKLVSSINTRLDKIISQNAETGKELTRQNSEINNLKGELGNHTKRLNDHAERLREVELKQASKGN